MKALTKSAVLAGLTLALVAAAATPANAQTARMWPSTGGMRLPVLGFQSFFNGNGEQVTGVYRGSTAAQMGLEPGDVIVALNGTPLDYDGAWRDALTDAVAQGHVVLAIWDWRTGNVAYRHLPLGYGPQVTTKGRR